MPFVRRHVYRRLKAAKQECDKELQRVTNSVTAFFEERLRDNEHEQEYEREQRELERERDRDSHQSEIVDALREGFVLQPAELRSALQFDEVSDGGYDADPEGSTRGRQPSISSNSPASYSPASIRRHPTLPRENRSLTHLPLTVGGTISPASSATPPPEVISPRKRDNTTSSTGSQWSGQSLASRRLSRTIHIPSRPSRSGASSRSTSRSRSPLPRSAFPDSSASMNNRRSSRILVDDPIDPIMTTLYEIIGVATDVVEMSISQLTAQPKICEQLVQRVQNIGKAWDEHPDWHGRKLQFWNFDDNDDEQEEPLLFVMKPADEETAAVVPATPSMKHGMAEAGSAVKVGADEEAKLRMYRTTSAGRRSRDDAPKELSMTPAHNAHKDPDHPRKRLRLQAETAQNQNIVLELSLDGDHFVWVNYAWRNVIGGDPEDLIDTRVSKLLAASDWHVFRDATRRLMEDDSHTVEVRFKQMEGKGMLMIEREDGRPSHTMWVVKPISSPEYLQAPPSILLETGEIGDEPTTPEPTPQVGFSDRCPNEPVTPFPFARPISTALILCRICECNIPQWYFEKHNETCSEVHRLEAEIGECNESIGELRSTIRELQTAMDRSSPMSVPEYRGMPIFSPSTSPSSNSPLALLRAPLKMKRMSVKKMQRQVLEQLEDILSLSAEVKIPSLKEDEAQEPIERQRLLSPASERKMSQVRRWNKPSIEDQALTQLVEDAERVMRQKIDNVVRMQNTIRYSEKIRQEWEEKVEQTLSMGEDEESDEEEEEDIEGEQEEELQHPLGSLRETEDDHSSTTSEYAFNGHNASSDPTPLAPSPAPYAETLERSESVASMASSVPAPVPTYHWPSSTFNTRSSTPSSISSPLALAAPIIASSCPDDIPPPMDLNDGHSLPIPMPGVSYSQRPRRSPQNLEPKLLITPPLSPMVSPQDVTARRANRRHSTAQPLISPTSSISNINGMPLSPRLPSVTPLSRTTPTSIKDFEIIKPISKGAFGSVFLAKKKVTGDYFAIKVLKKADMIAKNQITNVKAERMILMKQAESPFVAKLYFTFQSKENLYLVMEYLNGGDCAALIKSLGSLPEEWTRNYIAEVVLGLESLHQRGIVHRDLKPDNLLIDQHGHLKLTDFGLNDVSESSGSESVYNLFPRRNGVKQIGDSPLQSFATELTTDLRSHPTPGGTPPGEQKVVGTPDYLAPETILGLRGDDAAVDWWALGVITYEFLYGIPPFHDETPEKVFENILSGHIEWHDDYVDVSDEAKDFMARLMTLDPTHRLGANGAVEVKGHPFFTGIDWNAVTTTEAAFIPQVTDPESTDYFDPRGAVLQLFNEEDHLIPTSGTFSDSPSMSPEATLQSTLTAPVPLPNRDTTSTSSDDDFGSFSFKNLPVLKQANDDHPGYEVHTPPSSVASIDLKRAPDPHDRAVTCLLAEDNPITAKIIETLLIRLGCRCVVVADGSEAISVAMGDIKFDCILMDLHMPILDGEGAARYIKTTNNKNASTPIIAVSAYGASEPTEQNNPFTAYLAKPVQKADLLTVMRQLGFKTSTAPGRGPANARTTGAATSPTSLSLSTGVLAR
ncbi:hypothetical protein EW026_g134 [Hermanssonia centrifuga]|uniref:non-specific serine/threonine protein kinase n=1 Tax=Hermanssonia centrifuga TaxID=98765 RepID=A0A4V3XBN9_9APHY|nr:hypothetical protein EW026_g134 [Hermanssonia centrifuga]